MHGIKEVRAYLSYVSTVWSTALKGSLTISQSILTILFMCLCVAVWAFKKYISSFPSYLPTIEAIMNMSWWEISLMGLGAVMLVRLLLAPYWIYKKGISLVPSQSVPSQLGIEIIRTEILNSHVIVNFKLKPSKKMRLSKVELAYDHETVEGQIKNKYPRYIKSNITYKAEFPVFKDSEYAKARELKERELFAYGQERYKAKLQINTDAGQWPSSEFMIPTELKGTQFALQYDISKIGEMTIQRDRDHACYKITLPITLKFKNLGNDPIFVSKYARIVVETPGNPRRKWSTNL